MDKFELPKTTSAVSTPQVYPGTNTDIVLPPPVAATVPPPAPTVSKISAPVAQMTTTQKTSGQLPPPVVGGPNADAAKTYADSVNKAASTIKENITNKETTFGTQAPKEGTSDYYFSEIQNLAKNQPKAPESTFDMGKKLREEYGLDAEQAEFLAANQELQDIRAKRDVGYKTAGKRMISLSERGEAKDAVTAEFEDAERFLVARKQAAADAMQAKMSTINQLMDWKQTDYSNARQYYNDNFDRARTMYSTIYGQEKDEENKARANWQTAINAMNESGVDYNDVEPNMKSNLEKWALQSGLPKDFPKMLANLPDKKEIAFTSEGYDSNGNKTVSIFYKDKRGNISAPQTMYTGQKSQSESKPKDYSSELFAPEAQRSLARAGVPEMLISDMGALSKIGKLGAAFSFNDYVDVGGVQKRNPIKQQLMNLSTDQLYTLISETTSPEQAPDIIKPFIDAKLKASQTGVGGTRDTGRKKFLNDLLRTLPTDVQENIKSEVEDALYGQFGSSDYTTSAQNPKNHDAVVDAIARGLFK